MKLTKKSILTGIEHTIDLPITREEYELGEWKRKDGVYIQDAFPTLNVDQREFILNGITTEEWGNTFDDE